VSFIFPTNSERVTVIGRTGSGKTQKAAWLLSYANFHEQPWVIIDYKYDSLLNSIEGIGECDLKKVPDKPGLYIAHPPQGGDFIVDNFFWQVWAKENCGIFIDEAFMTPSYRRFHAYNALLTQGRSKHIPIISLTQRPAWISPFVFSESDYFSVFHLNSRTDQKKVEDFVPFDMKESLQEYHSHWYDVKRHRKFMMQPVPSRDIILNRFNTRLKQVAESNRVKRRFF